MPTPTEIRLAAIKDVLSKQPGHVWTDETLAWLVARVEASRLAYRERFNEGLTRAQWHDKHCAAFAAESRLEAALVLLEPDEITPQGARIIRAVLAGEPT